jgi:hypothetical protein
LIYLHGRPERSAQAVGPGQRGTGKRFLRLIRMIRGIASGDPEIMAIWREP